MDGELRVSFSARRGNGKPAPPPDPRLQEMRDLICAAQVGMEKRAYGTVLGLLRAYFRLYYQLYEDMGQLELEVVRMYAQALGRTGRVRRAVAQYLLSAHDIPNGKYVKDLAGTRAFYRDALEFVTALGRTDLVEFFRRRMLGLVVREYGLRDARTHREMLRMAEGQGKYRKAAEYRGRAVCGAVRALGDGDKGANVET